MSAELVHAHNYYRWIASHFQPHLGDRVLDIGGGHGSHLDHVVGPGRFVLSLDLSGDVVREMRHRFVDADFEALEGDITDPGLAERLSPMKFQTAICVNVLEHIEDDLKALRHMARILRSQGGRLFLLVPAHRFLYGKMDEMAGHYRRYGKSDLRRSLADAGFHLLKLYHFNFFGVLPYFVNGRLFRPSSLDAGSIGLQIRLFDRWLIPVLRRLENACRPPLGQSLIAIAGVSSAREKGEDGGAP